MRNFVASFRMTLRVAATCTAVLIVTPASRAQPGSPSGREPSQSEIEMRRRLEPLVPSIRSALEGDNRDAQRASLAIAADFPAGLAENAKLPGAIAAFLQRDSKDPEVVALAIRAFGRMQPTGTDLSNVVGKFIKSDSVVVRRSAAESLATAVQNSTPAQKSVPYALYFIDVSGKALPLLNDLINDADGATQRSALEGVQSASRATAELFQFDPGPLPEDPKAKEPGGRFAPVLPVLRGLAGTIPRLPTPLAAREPATRLAAARTLEAIAVTRRTILNTRPNGEPAPNDPFPDAWASLRPVLSERLSDDDAHVRLAVTEALESLGDAFEARQLMRKATNDQVVFVRWTAARALGKSAPAKPEAAKFADDIAALARLAGDPDPDVRIAALTGLAKYGTAAQSATPAVIAAATRGDVEPRVAAIKAFGFLETDAERTVPVLIGSLADSDLRVQRAAASGLVRFGPAAKAALPELRKAVLSTDPELRLAAAEAILAIERLRKLKEL